MSAQRKPIRITGARPDECPTCEGCGETRATCTEMGTTAKGKPRTLKQGSGCPDCHGIGRRQFGLDRIVTSPLKNLRFAAPASSKMTWDVYNSPNTGLRADGAQE